MPPLDPREQVTANLQEWGLQDINPELFQSYLDQYMKNLQGQGASPEVLRQLQEYMNEVYGRREGESDQQQGQGVQKLIGKGIDIGKQVTSAAEKYQGQKSSGEAPTRQPSGRETKTEDTKKAEQQGDVAGSTTASQGAPSGGITEGGYVAGQAAPSVSDVPYTGAAEYPVGSYPVLSPGGGMQINPAALDLGPMIKQFPGPASYGPGSIPDLQSSVSGPTSYLGQPAMDVPGAAIPNQGFNLGVEPLDTTGVYGATPGGGVTGTTGALGNIGAGLGALGGAYGLYNAFAGKGSPLSRAASGLTGAYGLYSGINTLAGLGGPTIGGIATDVLASIAPSVFGPAAGTAGVTTGTGALTTVAPEILSGAASSSAGTGAGVGAGSAAGAGLAGGLAAAPIAALAIAYGFINADQLESLRRGEAKAYQKFWNETAPKVLGELSSSGDIARSVTPAAGPANAASAYNRLEGIINDLNTSGVESRIFKSSEPGPVSLTDAASAAQGVTPQPTTTVLNKPPTEYPWANQYLPYLAATDLGRIRALDVLGSSGNIDASNPLQWAGTGGYTLPSYASGTHASPLVWSREILGSKEGGMAPSAFLDPRSYSAEDTSRPNLSEYLGKPDPGRSGYTYTPWGDVPTSLYDWAKGVQPGALESSLTELAKQYGVPSPAEQLGGGLTAGLPTGGPSLSAGTGLGGGLRSGGGSDPEKGLPGIASATSQAALGSNPNPWQKGPSSATVQPLATLDDLIAQAQAMGSGQG